MGYTDHNILTTKNNTSMENTKHEIAPGIQWEQPTPEFLSPSWLTEQPQVVYRLDMSGKRYYYTKDEQNNPTFFLSVTSFIQRSLPTPPELIDWMVGMGKEASSKYATERAHYGTFLHKECASLLINAKYDLDLLIVSLDQYIEDNHLPYEFRNNASELRKDVLAFAQFIIDYNVEPVAIEIILTHPEWGIAGAIDLVAWIDVEVDALSDEVFKTGPRAGQKKPIKVKERQLAIIDLKSGRKGFHDSHKIQLHAYKAMWERNFKDMVIQQLYNFSPKEWRGSVPTYNFTCQTNAKIARKLEQLIEIAKIEDDKAINSVTVCHGLIDITKGLYSNVEFVELSELVKRK